jgi:hypothetical protein
MRLRLVRRFGLFIEMEEPVFGSFFILSDAGCTAVVADRSGWCSSRVDEMEG